MHVLPLVASWELDDESVLRETSHNESSMTDSGKTLVANVLVALSCCTIAAMAFQSHRARSEDRWIDVKYEALMIRFEATARTRPASTTEENAVAGSPVVLTCRPDYVNLAPGVHKD